MKAPIPTVRTTPPRRTTKGVGGWRNGELPEDPQRPIGVQPIIWSEARLEIDGFTSTDAVWRKLLFAISTLALKGPSV